MEEHSQRSEVRSRYPLTLHIREFVYNSRNAAVENVKGPGNALKAQHVIAIGWDVDLVQDFLTGIVGLTVRGFSQLFLKHLLL
jgi:hypothetical protein